jgi:hypothetical protein
MSLRRFMWATWVALSLSFGCEPVDEGSIEPDVTTRTDLLIESGACNAGNINSPGVFLSQWSAGSATSTCDGAWQYRENLTCRNLAACGCETPGTCTSWLNGMASGLASSDHSVTVTVPGEKVCSYDPEVGVECEFIPDITAGMAACTAKVQASVDVKKSAITAAQQAAGLQPAGQFLAHVSLVPGTKQFTLDPNDETRATCAYRIQFPQPRHATSQTACGCAVAANCQNDTCGASPTPKWSAVRLTLNQLRATVTDKALHEGAQSPRCTTADDVSTASARYTSLLDFQSQVPLARADARTAIEKSKMLVYERSGQSLSDAQRADARGLYQSSPHLAPACGTRAHTCNALTAAYPTVANELMRCTRLLSPHVSQELVRLELQACLEVVQRSVPASALASFFTSCAASAVPHPVDEVFEMEERLWEKQFSLTAPASPEAPSQTAQRLQNLGKQLWSLDSLQYNAAYLRNADTRLSEAARKDVLFSDLSRWTKKWWDRADSAYHITGPTLTALDASQQAQLLDSLVAGRRGGDQAARELLTALFTPIQGVWLGQSITSVPTDGEVLYTMMADAIEPLVTRLSDLSVFHDFSCVLRECKTTSSPLSQTYRLLSALADPTTALPAAVAETTSDLSMWRPVFVQVNAQSSWLLPLATFFQSPKVSGPSPNLEAVSPFARRLVQLILEARLHHTRYHQEGLFTSALNLLRTGQHVELRNEIANLMTTKRNELQTQHDRFTNDVLQFARAQLGQTSQGTEQFRAEKLEAQKALEHETLGKDIGGLSASAAAADLEFGKAVKAFAAIEGALDQNEFIQQGTSVRFEVSGADARYRDGGVLGSTVEGLAVRAPLELTAGQLLSIEVDPSDRWTPTCSLRESRFLSPVNGEDALLADVNGALAGPDGYSLNFADEKYTAASVSDSTQTAIQIGYKAELCIKMGGAIVKVIGIDAQACAFITGSKTWSTTSEHSDGATERQSAAFAVGLRLDSTPFNRAPVGALLAVVVNTQTQAISDVQVVRAPSTNVIATGPSRVYFVVNDKRCDTPVASEKLFVTAKTLTTLKAVAEATTTAMSQVLAEMNAKRAVFKGQGRLLPSETNALRLGAAQSLNERLAPVGFTLETLPPPLTTLFSAFVEKEIVAIEREVEIQELQRRQALILLELEALRYEIEVGAQNAKLHELILNIMVRNLDGQYLREKSLDLLSQTRDYLYPALKVWYPKHLTAKLALPETSSFKVALAQLSTTMPIDQPVLQLVKPTVEVVGHLLDGFRDATFGNVPSAANPFIVRLSFPKPRALVPNPLGTYGSSSKTVDGVRAKLFWDAVETLQWAPVTILPEDVYTGLSPQGTLPCNEATPVIRRIGFYFGAANGNAYPQSDQMNQLGRLLSGYAPKRQVFMTEVGDLEFLLTPDSPFQSVAGQVFYGVSSKANEVLTTKVYDPARPVGLSPFGTYHLDFSRVQQPINGGGWADPNFGTGIAQAEEFVVVMELDSKKLGTVVSTPSCVTLASPPNAIPVRGAP